MDNDPNTSGPAIARKAAADIHNAYSQQRAMRRVGASAPSLAGSTIQTPSLAGAAVAGRIPPLAEGSD